MWGLQPAHPSHPELPAQLEGRREGQDSMWKALEGSE